MTNENKQNAKAADVPEATALTVDQVVEQIRSMTASLPQYDTQVPPNRLSKLLRVDERFIAAVANGIANVPEVQQILGSSSEELRGNADESLRWTAAIDAARALVAMLEGANLQRRQRNGLKALQGYKICQQLVRDGNHAATLGTHVAEMKRLSNFSRKRKPAATPDQPQKQST